MNFLGVVKHPERRAEHQSIIDLIGGPEPRTEIGMDRIHRITVIRLNGAKRKRHLSAGSNLQLVLREIEIDVGKIAQAIKGRVVFIPQTNIHAQSWTDLPLILNEGTINLLPLVHLRKSFCADGLWDSEQ